MAGTFNRTNITELKLNLSELNHKAEISAKCHLTKKSLNYDLNLGKDVLHELGIFFISIPKLLPGKKFLLQ